MCFGCTGLLSHVPYTLQSETLVMYLRECYKINGRNAPAVYYRQITIPKLLQHYIIKDTNNIRL